MARPKMKFTPDEALSLINEFTLGLRDLHFCEKNLLAEADKWPGSTMLDAQKAFEPLAAMAYAARNWRNNPEPLTEESSALLKKWITTWVSPEGWTRLLAARRQRNLKNRQTGSQKVTPVAAPDRAAHLLSEMAQAAGMNRSVFVDKLVIHLCRDTEGRTFIKQFNLKLLAEQREEGHQMLLEVFGETKEHYERILKQLPGERLEHHKQAVDAVQKLGKSKLTKFEVLVRKLVPSNSLCFALLPQEQLAGRSPLGAFSEGESLVLLKAPTVRKT